MLERAVFVGAEDIRARRCVGRAEQCRPGDLFVPQAFGGTDEHEAVEEAVRRGAAAIVTERLLPVSVPQCLVEDNRVAFGVICQALAGSPSLRMLSIAVAGTHGKTATSLFLSSMLKGVGGSVAYYTSLGSSDSVTCDRSTTQQPSARKLADWMRRADLAGSPSMVMEVGQPMLQHQVTAGVEFDLLVLTGMRCSQTRGSASQRRYQQWIDELAERMKPHGMLLVNADDAHASQWASASDRTTIEYGLDAAEHIRGKRLSRAGGQQQILIRAGNTLMPLTLNMPGDHMARAALAAVAAGWMFDFPLAELIHHVEKMQSIPGRMQRVATSVDVPVFVDAADTPDRMAVALHALRQHQFGDCTAVVDLSDRLHPNWRTRLGEVLEKSAARVVLTASGLPADEARNVAMDVLGGLKNPGRHEVIANRAQAIRWAINHTDRGCVLLAGCGASTWLTSEEGLPVCDESVAKTALAERLSRTVAAAPALSVFPPPSASGVVL
ncbi:MAG: Mur ligase family protein [Aureliella sp.]